jgi:protein-tyrosine phosphatase
MNTENLQADSIAQQLPPHITFDGHRRLFGGSFFDAPEPGHFLTINLMAESPQLVSDIYLPIVDYSIPEDPFAMIQAFEAIRQSDKDAYVGCWGGKGRTGLFMSCFLKYLGQEDALKTVRRDYNEHAVETPEQMAFLDNFPVAPSLRSRGPK